MNIMPQSRRASSHKFQLSLHTEEAMFFFFASRQLLIISMPISVNIYLLYESWLHDVFQVYTSLKPHILSQMQEAYVYTANFL